MRLDERKEKNIPLNAIVPLGFNVERGQKKEQKSFGVSLSSAKHQRADRRYYVCAPWVKESQTKTVQIFSFPAIEIQLIRARRVVENHGSTCKTTIHREAQRRLSSSSGQYCEQLNTSIARGTL